MSYQGLVRKRYYFYMLMCGGSLLLAMTDHKIPASIGLLVVTLMSLRLMSYHDHYKSYYKYYATYGLLVWVYPKKHSLAYMPRTYILKGDYLKALSHEGENIKLEASHIRALENYNRIANMDYWLEPLKQPKQ